MPRGRATAVNSAKLVPVEVVPGFRATKTTWADETVQAFLLSGNHASLVEIDYVNGKNPVAACQRLRESVRRANEPVAVSQRNEEVYLIRKNTEESAEETDGGNER